MKCKTCKWHKKIEREVPATAPPWMYNQILGGYCECPKFYEDTFSPAGEEPYMPDHLVYSYNESGSFWTGSNFGCVHHVQQD